MKYPGTFNHQQILQAISTFYANDSRILAVGLFGSLVRGNWDELSDLDLDVVIRDNLHLDVVEEVRQLTASFASIGEEAALIVLDGDDAADVVLRSFIRFSIRYHPLHNTSPNIIDSLQLITGKLDLAMIQAAGLANRSKQEPSLPQTLEALMWYIVGVDVALQRRRLWLALELLHRSRGLLMLIFSQVRGGVRPLQVFEAEAEAVLQTQLGKTLPQYDESDIHESFKMLIELVLNDLGVWSQRQLQLTQAQRDLLQRVINHNTTTN